MDENPLKLKRMGLHERAADRMRTMIVCGCRELPPGSQTQKSQLSRSLSVPRTRFAKP